VLEAGNRLTGTHDAQPKIGKDGKYQFNLYDPDGTRIELMNFHASEKAVLFAVYGGGSGGVGNRRVSVNSPLEAAECRSWDHAAALSIAARFNAFRRGVCLSTSNCRVGDNPIRTPKSFENRSVFNLSCVS